MNKVSNFKKACPNWSFSLESQKYIDEKGVECTEIWKWIKGYKWVYEISNIGRVKTHNWRATGRTMIVTPKITNDGYLWYRLSKNNKDVSIKIHRLVAAHFLNNPQKMPEVNHKDGNKLNNNSSNLEWCTHAENMAHFGKIIYKKGEWGGFNSTQSVMSIKQVTDIRSGVYDHLTTAQLSRMIKVGWNTIDRVRKGISYPQISQKNGVGVYTKWAKDNVFVNRNKKTI